MLAPLNSHAKSVLKQYRGLLLTHNKLLFFHYLIWCVCPISIRQHLLQIQNIAHIIAAAAAGLVLVFFAQDNR